ncbi:unnamed protein product [Strongylus vulgaris]|uniref:Uncharacterized protein n=1 Tax=Strongylus vulgaris TaxID=40348 RepID=A0A3P7J1C4_STRVU|nr:unnamed protein product [Strongylus vulgaris]
MTKRSLTLFQEEAGSRSTEDKVVDRWSVGGQLVTTGPRSDLLRNRPPLVDPPRCGICILPWQISHPTLVRQNVGIPRDSSSPEGTPGPPHDSGTLSFTAIRMQTRRQKARRPPHDSGTLFFTAIRMQSNWTGFVSQTRVLHLWNQCGSRAAAAVLRKFANGHWRTNGLLEETEDDR